MIARFVTLSSFALLAACSNYQADFKKAALLYQKSPKPPTTPEGPWKGTWKSDTNGHEGPLWCLVTPDADKANQWNFRYRAGWGLVQFGDYEHPVTATLNQAGNLALNHEMKLPNNFGTYKVVGTITPTEFKVRYDSKDDRGTMTLTRPQKQAK